MRNLTAMLLTAPLALISNSAFAQQAEPEIEILRLEAPEGDVDAGKARPWVNIGADPFRGDVAKGAEVLSAKTAYNPSDILEGARMRSLGLCHRYTLKNGDQMRTTFDVNRSMLAQVSFASGEPRGSDVCIVQRLSGAEVARAVVFPDGCTNVSAASAIVKIIRRDVAKQEETPPQVTKVPSVPVITTVVGPRAPEAGFQMNPLFLGIPLPNYAGGNTNITTRSSAAVAASAKTEGACQRSCPTNPNHRP